MRGYSNCFQFIIHAYHLKDALRAAAPSLGLNASDFEDAITNDLRLALLADLANLDKHLKLTKPPRSGCVPVIEQISGFDSAAGNKLLLSVNIKHDTVILDGLAVARDAIAAWQEKLWRGESFDAQSGGQPGAVPKSGAAPLTLNVRYSHATAIVEQNFDVTQQEVIMNRTALFLALAVVWGQFLLTSMSMVTIEKMAHMFKATLKVALTNTATTTEVRKPMEVTSAMSTALAPEPPIAAIPAMVGVTTTVTA